MLRIFILFISLTGVIGCRTSSSGNGNAETTEEPTTVLRYNCSATNRTNTSRLVDVLQHNDSCTVLVKWDADIPEETTEIDRNRICNYIGSDVCSNCSVNASYEINTTNVLFSCYNEYDFTTTSIPTTAKETTYYQDTDTSDTVNFEKATTPEMQGGMNIGVYIAIGCGVAIVLIVLILIMRFIRSRESGKPGTNDKENYSKGEGQSGDLYAVVKKENIVVDNILYESKSGSDFNQEQTDRNSDIYTVPMKDFKNGKKNNILYSERASLEIEDATSPPMYSVVKKHS